MCPYSPKCRKIIELQVLILVSVVVAFWPAGRHRWQIFRRADFYHYLLAHLRMLIRNEDSAIEFNGKTHDENSP